MKRESRFPAVIALIVLTSLYLPIIIMVINSFNGAKYGSEWQGFSLKWYKQMFNDSAIWSAVCTSMMVGVISTLISTIFGVLSAYAIRRFWSRRQSVHYLLIYTPLIVPDILLGMGLLLLFIMFHFQLGIISIIVAHITFSISYVAMVVLGRLQNFDFTLIDAAYDLGASQWTAVRTVLVPLISPGILAGALIAFTLSMDDFVVTFFVAGPGISTLPIHIYGMMKYGALPVINALSVIFLLITVVIILLIHKLSGDIA